jgi:hypothetical protein
VYSKADDATRELVHDNKDPVALQENGFTPEKINAPETVLGVSDESQP